MKPKIIITGGNGYIGSVLAANLSSRYFIYILDKSKKNSFLKYKNITFIKNNLIHYNKTLRIIKRINPEVVVHLAAQSTIDMVKKKKKFLFF